MTAAETVLAVEGLSVATVSGANIVEDVSFRLRRGEILGLVGESGSGKTTTALALLGYARPGLRIAAGSVAVVGEEILRSPAGIRQLRGRCISYVPQEPAAALNPSLRVEDQIAEMLRANGSKWTREARIQEVLASVHLPGDRAFRRRFPHQLSGGQQQRLAIAVALGRRPQVLVLDEPATGLDVITQARILDEVGRLRRETGVAMVYVSHDMAVIASVCERVAVMYAGRIVEEGPTEAVISSPRHPYTRGLVESVPDHTVRRALRGIPGVAVGVQDRPPGCPFAPRCPQCVERCEQAVPDLLEVGPAHRARCVEWRRTPPLELAPRAEPRIAAEKASALLVVRDLRAVYATRRAVVVAAANFSFEVAAGECVALVGESGSGKTTIARCIVGLHERAGGEVFLSGTSLPPFARNRPREARRRIQIVFQNPTDSLNPRQTVEDEVSWPARLFRGLSARAARAEVPAMLELVRLPTSTASRYPGELSGGERQRVAIARALAAAPDLLVCDEITSALDVSVQAAVLNLLGDLRRDLGLALLLITHDLGVVASVADRVLVLERGVVREEGPVDSLLAAPADDYTRRLVAAAPSITQVRPVAAARYPPRSGRVTLEAAGAETTEERLR